MLLAAGWRTRWVTAASWVLMMSLQARNPAVRNGGDEIVLAGGSRPHAKSAPFPCQRVMRGRAGPKST